jgi:Protein of unknown function (DUF3363)
LKPDLKPAWRDLGIRGDIVKTMDRAVSAADREPDVAGFALHGEEANEPVLGRLVERGLHDELKGSAYAIIDSVDGRTHHLVFSDLEMTGDARPGAIVETRAYDDADDRKRLSIASRSDLAIEAQVSAPGATWLDRQLLAKESALASDGFGAEVREAMDAEGEHVSGVYRRRVTLASGRFAMIDDVMGFQLLPWRPALEQQLGHHVSGVTAPGGGRCQFHAQAGYRSSPGQGRAGAGGRAACERREGEDLAIGARQAHELQRRHPQPSCGPGHRLSSFRQRRLQARGRPS